MADEIDIVGVSNIEDLDIATVHDVQVTHVKAIDPLTIERVRNIAPVAAHIKEVNHIDPISIDALHVTEVRNIEPINVERFNVTNLPTLNMSVRQLPPVEMNVGRLPPVSIGTHQHFEIPSNYLVRARLFGIEFFRLHLCGQTTVLPHERYRREQSRTPSQSFPTVATAGNPAIPSIHQEKSAVTYHPAGHPHGSPGCHPDHGDPVGRTTFPQAATRAGARAGHVATGNPSGSGSLHFGTPAVGYRMPDAESEETPGGSSVRSGG